MKFFSIGWISLLTFCLTLPGEASTIDKNFTCFWNEFKRIVAENNPKSLAKVINFPVTIFGHQYTEAQFIENKDESINFFSNKYIIHEVVSGSLDDVVYYEKGSDLGADECPTIPKDIPVYEFDIINDKGGPAIRLILAKKTTKFQLFCVLQ
jgi:hypothetical protein